MTAVPYARRQFPGGAVFTTVPTGIGEFDVSCSLLSDDNWPTSAGGNFYVGVDFNQPTFEKILCTGTSSLVLSFAAGGRGADGTTAVEHAPGCEIFICSVAQDDDEANQVVSLLGNAASGSLFVGAGTSTLPSVLPVGSTGRVLTVVGGTPAWAGVGSPSMNAASIEASFTAEGQLYAGTGNGTGEQLAKGSAGQVLTVGGSDSSGLEWAAIPPWLTPTAQTTTYSANNGDLVQANATSAAFAVTVPVTTGAVVCVKKMDATATHAVTITPASGTIDGQASLKLYGQYAGYVVCGDGTNANVVGVLSSVWQNYTPSWTTNGTAPAIGNGGLAGQWQQIGSTINIQLNMFAGSTTTFGTGDYELSLPFTMHVGGSGQCQSFLMGPCQAGSTYYLGSSGGIEGFSGAILVSVATTGANVTNTAPATQTSSSSICLVGTIQTT